ncbi:hypothetical protein GCK32_008587 [Trichostrongylus colubriformis]|uniref:P2X purinoreceptor 7 intracellular domain-containing protein n=1 Tax=Trichostrongylus colubriformis TaxID=6319 RepID=A0AAN8J306_TRICO
MCSVKPELCLISIDASRLHAQPEISEEDDEMPTCDEKRSLRYCVYRTFVFWAYGRLGMNRRYELPACVRGAIMQAFPSDSGARRIVVTRVRFETYQSLRPEPHVN